MIATRDLTLQVSYAPIPCRKKQDLLSFVNEFCPFVYDSYPCAQSIEGKLKPIS